LEICHDTNNSTDRATEESIATKTGKEEEQKQCRQAIENQGISIAGTLPTAEGMGPQCRK
jgi:hypothetical protein